MFDLRAISPFAPISDLVLGIVLILGAVALANLAAVLNAYRQNVGSAGVLLLITGLGTVAAIVALLIRPPELYRVAFIYAVCFTIAAYVVGARGMGWLRATVRVSFGGACMVVAIAIAYWLAFAPR
jgi:hypothetical protein